MAKKILAALLALVMILSMAACSESKSDKDSKKDKKSNEQKIPKGALVFDQGAEVKPGTVKNALDPEEVYANLTYTPQMFYGYYEIQDDEEKEAFIEEQEALAEEDEDFVALPYIFQAGEHSMAHMINYIKGKNFACLYTVTDVEYCAYTIDGNTITFNPIDTFEYNEEQQRIRYSMTDEFFSYEFKFEGRNLTLISGDQSVTLSVYDDENVYGDGFVAADSAKIGNVDSISFSYHEDDGKLTNYFYMEDRDWTYQHVCYAVLEENGLLTITEPMDDETVKVHQYVYFLCGFDGLILTDGEEVYYYTADRWDTDFGDNLSIEDYEKLENMDEDEIEEIKQKQADLLKDLAEAYEEAGLGVTVNEETGEIALDAAVLFPVNEYEVSEEGKELLDQFIQIYCSVVFDEKYEDFVSTIMVEGHTDSSGDYASNEILSQNRAESVATHCIAAGGEYTEALEGMMKAVGYASDNPVLDSKGKEDKAASRRVCFRFLINLG